MKILVVLGTRPEAIKLAPVIMELRRRPGLDTRVCVTGQHRQMLDQMLVEFDIRPDYDLDVMRSRQELSPLTARALVDLARVVRKERPDWVVVQGDTTSALAGALAAVQAKVPIGHVEAGLRTGDLSQPWPEEANRRVVDCLADALWAPTEAAKANLERENLGARHVLVTGNTVVDALNGARARLRENASAREACRAAFPFANGTRRLVLVTGHRRENIGARLQQVCLALRQLAGRDDVEIVYVAHLNPRVLTPIRRSLRGFHNIHVILPVPYVEFVYLLERAHVVLTDSGGVQEEAPVIGRPVLVMRDRTERPEPLETGTTRMVGSDPSRVVSAVHELLDDAALHARMCKPHVAFGDGRASERIADHLCRLSSTTHGS